MCVKLFGWGMIFFFFNKKQKLFKDYFKAQFFGDRCPGQSKRVRAWPTADVFFVSSLDVTFLVGDMAK